MTTSTGVPYGTRYDTREMIPATGPSPTARSNRPRFLSDADCRDIAQRLDRYAVGGGYTGVLITSSWRGTVRWARNRVSIASDLLTNHLTIGRNLHGARNQDVSINETSDEALVAALRRAERLARLEPEQANPDMVTHVLQEPALAPTLFSEATYQLDAEHRSVIARDLAKSAETAGMLSSGYIEVSAHSQAFITSWGIARYFQYTGAQCSLTVRDPKGTGSGWAGVDWHDWQKIDGPALAAIALAKCLASQNPVRVEPGRYTTILEPQAVADLTQVLMNYLGRNEGNGRDNETNNSMPFNKVGQDTNNPGFSYLGERMVDERITISADPMDPDLGFPPFGFEAANGELFNLAELPVYHPTTWIDRGVLTNLAYGRSYGLRELGQNTGRPNSGAFRMSGGDTSIDDMIATTKRGLLVTRFDQSQRLQGRSLLCRGYTRDGLWLIENGKISKPCKNLAFTESPLFVLNNVEQLGVPQRVYHPSGSAWNERPQPIVVPPLKVREFSFTALIDAV